MKYKAYYTDTPDPVSVPDDSYVIIEAQDIMDCVVKTMDYSDKYFWEFEEVTE